MCFAPTWSAPRDDQCMNATSQNEAAQAASDARYRAIVHSALDAIIVIDDAGFIREFNPAAERVFGWTREQVAGLDIALFIPPDLRDRRHRGFLRYLKTG